MSGGSLTVDYFGYVEVSRFCSDAALQWVARDLSSKTTARCDTFPTHSLKLTSEFFEDQKINISIHNSYINLLCETGLITGIPFSFQSPYSCNTTTVHSMTTDETSSLLYLTELSLVSLKLLCHVFLLDTNRQALNLKENIEMLKEGALNARQRTLQRQVTETLERQVMDMGTAPGGTPLSGGAGSGRGRLEKHRRSLSEERIPASVTQVVTEKSRRSSENQGLNSARRIVKLHRRRKSTPIKCREIYDVEYIGSQASVACQLPDIDRTVKEVLSRKQRTSPDNTTTIKGLLHIGYSEIQLLHCDHVTMIRAWPIKHIKACSQGQDSSYIGWSCRQVLDEEARENVHVFRAESPDMGVTILHSIHKMCLNAYNQVNEPEDDLRNKGLCKSCPIVIFNNLCMKLLGFSSDEVVQELSEVIGRLSERESLEVLQMFKTEQTDVSAQNSLLVGCLRTIYERRQTDHSHDTPTKQKTRRSRAVTVANLFEPTIIENPTPDNTVASGARKPKSPHKSSVRIAIYESVNTENLSIISSLEDDSTITDNLSYNSERFDAMSEIESQQEELWGSIFLKIETSPETASFREEVESAVYKGVPESMRGKVWNILAKLKKSKEPTPSTVMSYEQLKEGASTAAANTIQLDIGRTFPTHPYFKEEGGLGQTAMYNVLKAYSTFDMEVVYCQGMNFVAGLLLAHLAEEEAFHLLLDLMYKCSLRDVYKPHMAGLKMGLYQLSRLLHDRQLQLHEHLSTHEVTPSLYAVPWIMTAFATQLPFRLAARIMDFILLQGTDAIFKVILYVLEASEEDVLSLKNFESLMNFMKESVLHKIDHSFEYRVREVFGVDMSVELRELEIEYKVLHEDLENANKTQFLETKYNLLKLQNKCHSAQIAQLTRDLQQARSDKRELLEEVEMVRDLQQACSDKTEEVDMVRKLILVDEKGWEKLVTQLKGQIEILEGDNEMLRNENLILKGEEDKVLGDTFEDGAMLGDGLAVGEAHIYDELSIANIENMISDQYKRPHWN